MSLARTFLRPVAMLAGRHAARQVRTFCLAHQQTRKVQDDLLAALLSRHAQTDFGRDHGFAGLRNYEDFTSAVPVGSYQTLRPYMDRVFAGKTDALLPPGERVLMFSRTSGTTGQPKHIPVTARFAAEMQRGWNVFGLKVLQDHPEGWLRPILQITSPMRETDSPTGLPCGAISGLLAAKQKRIVRSMYVVPPWVGHIDEAAVKYYTMLRYAVGRNVSIISTANPSSVIKLIETGQAHAERLIRDVADGKFTPPGRGGPPPTKDGRLKPNPSLAARMENGMKRDGELRPEHFWNISFLTHWTGGTLQLYLPRLRALFGNVPIRDIGLVASEGRFSLPMEDHVSAGVAEITSNFLEFIPAEQIESSNPTTLRADEVQVGSEYFLVITNWGGLWRYNIDDRVRVVDRFGDSPVFEFLSRGLHTANITGEKITEHQVVEAMRAAVRETQMPVERFVLQGRFAKTPYYELRLESPGRHDVDRLAEEMDKALSNLNIEYASKRSSGRLGPIRPRVLPPGALEQAEANTIRSRNGRMEQYKHQYLLRDVINEQ